MEQRAAAMLADIFQTMPKDPTIDELDAELRPYRPPMATIQGGRGDGKK